jgi:hypothetical protein
VFGKAAVFGRARSRSSWHPVNYIVRADAPPNCRQSLLMPEGY